MKGYRKRPRWPVRIQFGQKSLHSQDYYMPCNVLMGHSLVTRLAINGLLAHYSKLPRVGVLAPSAPTKAAGASIRA